MFNLYLHKRLLAAEQKVASEQELNVKNLAKERSLRKTLAAKYEKRVENFITSMARDLVLEHPNTRDSGKFIKTYMERTDSATEEQIFEMKAAYGFRGGNESPTKMRTALNSTWSLGRTAPCTLRRQEDCLTMDPGKARKRPMTANVQRRQEEKRPTSAVTRKTHFKGAMTKMIVGAKEEQKMTETVGRKREPGILLIRRQDRGVSPTLGHSETLVMTKDVLESCNVIERTRPSSSYLKMGSGRLTSNPRMSTKDLYQQLYKPINFLPGQFVL